jgi:hypothetical protein
VRSPGALRKWRSGVPSREEAIALRPLLFRPEIDVATLASAIALKEMESRDFFICLHVWLEKYVSSGDYRKHALRYPPSELWAEAHPGQKTQENRI